MIFADPPYFLSNGGISVQSGKQVSVNKGEWDKSQGFEKDNEFNSLFSAYVGSGFCGAYPSKYQFPL